MIAPRYEDIITLLVDNFADIDLFDDEGESPLQKAVEKNLFSTVNFLVNSGANVNILSEAGRTALQMAISTGVAEFLVSMGATETGACECLDGQGFSEVACPVADGAEGTSEYCEACDGGFTLKNHQCVIPETCDEHICPENRVCLIVEALATCSQTYMMGFPKMLYFRVKSLGPFLSKKRDFSRFFG